MKKYIVYSLVVAGILVSRGLVYADHDKSCKNVHGKVTVVTEDSMDDKMYKVGKSTRITKGDKVVKLEKIAAGDLVCLDARGKDDIGGNEVAAVTVLTASDPLAVREKESVREKEIVRQISHDKNCKHLHGKVTRIEDSVLFVDDKPYVLRTTTLVRKEGKITKIETLKPGDFVCVDKADEDVTSVVVLSLSDAAPFQSRETIRETIREEK